MIVWHLICIAVTAIITVVVVILFSARVFVAISFCSVEANCVLISNIAVLSIGALVACTSVVSFYWTRTYFFHLRTSKRNFSTLAIVFYHLTNLFYSPSHLLYASFS